MNFKNFIRCRSDRSDFINEKEIDNLTKLYRKVAKYLGDVDEKVIRRNLMVSLQHFGIDANRVRMFKIPETWMNRSNIKRIERNKVSTKTLTLRLLDVMEDYKSRTLLTVAADGDGSAHIYIIDAVRSQLIQVSNERNVTMRNIPLRGQKGEVPRFKILDINSRMIDKLDVLAIWYLVDKDAEVDYNFDKFDPKKKVEESESRVSRFRRNPRRAEKCVNESKREKLDEDCITISFEDELPCKFLRIPLDNEYADCQCVDPEDFAEPDDEEVCFTRSIDPDKFVDSDDVEDDIEDAENAENAEDAEDAEDAENELLFDDDEEE